MRSGLPVMGAVPIIVAWVNPPVARDVHVWAKQNRVGVLESSHVRATLPCAGQVLVGAAAQEWSPGSSTARAKSPPAREVFSSAVAALANANVGPAASLPVIHCKVQYRPWLVSLSLCEARLCVSIIAAGGVRKSVRENVPEPR